MPRKHGSMTAAVRRAIEGKPSYAQMEQELQHARSLIEDLKEENRQLRTLQAERQLAGRAAAALQRRPWRI